MNSFQVTCLCGHDHWIYEDDYCVVVISCPCTRLIAFDSDTKEAIEVEITVK